jgi:glycine betaine/proline transport system substrate-binding protein
MREPLDKAVEEGSLSMQRRSLSRAALRAGGSRNIIADANPDIKTIDDALARPELFPARGRRKQRAPSTTARRAGTAASRPQTSSVHIDAEEKGFVLVDSGSAAGLDGSLIANAYERKKAGSATTGRQPPSSATIR